MKHNFLHIPLQIVTLFAMEYFFFLIFRVCNGLFFHCKLWRTFLLKIHHNIHFVIVGWQIFGRKIRRKCPLQSPFATVSFSVANSDGFSSVVKFVAIWDGHIIRRKFNLRRQFLRRTQNYFATDFLCLVTEFFRR